MAHALIEPMVNGASLRISETSIDYGKPHVFLGDEVSLWPEGAPMAGDVRAIRVVQSVDPGYAIAEFCTKSGKFQFCGKFQFFGVNVIIKWGDLRAIAAALAADVVATNATKEEG